MLSINSTEFSISQQPDGLKELTHRVYFSDELGGYLEEFSGDLTFTGADYNYLRRRFFLDGCAVVPVTLVDSCGISLNGNLFLNEAEWRPDICAMTVQVVDAGFLSLIDNNKNIKAFVNVPRSKNDVAIYAAEQTDLQFKAYDTINNTDTAANRHGVRVYDALKMLVEFMSDGLISFESNFFFPDDNPSIDRPRIPTLITGRSIRTGASDSFPFISFQELYSDLNKLYNLAFATEITPTGVVLRIEPKTYFRDLSPSMTMDNPNEIRQNADTTTFYANIKYGSAKEDEYVFFPGGALPPSLPFMQWSQEQFHMGGQCNTDTTLDLQLRTLISDTNIIMRCLPFGSGNPQSIVNPADDSYDEDVMIVLFDANNITITSVNPLDTDVVYYNGRLRNNEVAGRWGDGIPFPIFLFLGGNTNNDARGYVSTNAAIDTRPLPPFFMAQWWFDNIGFTTYTAIMEFPIRVAPNGYDPSSNMADGTVTAPSPLAPFNATWYEAPLTAVYNINARIISDGDMRSMVIAQSRAGVLVQTSQIFFWNGYPNLEPNPYVNRTFDLSMTAVAAAGDRFYVVCVGAGQVAYPPPAPAIPPIIKQGSFMEVFADGNEITQTYDPAENYLIETSFEYPTAPETWRDFLNQRFGTFTVTHPNGRVRGFLKEANRNLHTGKTDWVLRSNFGDS